MMFRGAWSCLSVSQQKTTLGGFSFELWAMSFGALLSRFYTSYFLIYPQLGYDQSISPISAVSFGRFGRSSPPRTLGEPRPGQQLCLAM